jgi:hypothetical protein
MGQARDGCAMLAEDALELLFQGTVEFLSQTSPGWQMNLLTECS